MLEADLLGRVSPTFRSKHLRLSSLPTSCANNRDRQSRSLRWTAPTCGAYIEEHAKLKDYAGNALPVPRSRDHAVAIVWKVT